MCNKRAVCGAAVGFTGVSVSVGTLVVPSGRIPIVYAVATVRRAAVVANCLCLTGGIAAVTVRRFGMRPVDCAGAAVRVVTV